MPLPTGQWNLKGNNGELAIRSVDPQGRVDGTINDQLLEGFWDDQAHKLVFTSMKLTHPSTMQIYTGYVLSYAITDVRFARLVGSVETISFNETGVRRDVDGWVAEINLGIVVGSQS
jgi:hypothetical protein